MELHNKEDIKSMRSRNVNAFLVGESLMTTNDPGKKLQELFFEKINFYLVRLY